MLANVAADDDDDDDCDGRICHIEEVDVRERNRCEGRCRNMIFLTIITLVAPNELYDWFGTLRTDTIANTPHEEEEEEEEEVDRRLMGTPSTNSSL